MAKARRKAVAPVSDGIIIGSGVTLIKADGDDIVVTIDLTGDLGPSSSGKSRKVATTGGNTSVLGGLKMGVNVYDPIPDRPALSIADLADSDRQAMGVNLEIEVRNGVLSVFIDSGLDFGPPRQLFKLPGLTARFDVAGDGTGFVVILDRPGVRPGHLNVVLNWFEELKQLAPPGR